MGHLLVKYRAVVQNSLIWIPLAVLYFAAVRYDQEKRAKELCYEQNKRSIPKLYKNDKLGWHPLHDQGRPQYKRDHVCAEKPKRNRQR